MAKKSVAAAVKKAIVDSAEYNADSIKQLPFPLCVQVRPGMYISGNDSGGMLVCVREILNNSVDEFLAGFCNYIEIIRVSANTFIVRDNGRGIPFDKHESGKNALEVIFGELHAGRNFEEKTVYSTGINGVGGSCVNALSEKFLVKSVRGTKGATIEFNDGVVNSVKVLKTATAPTGKQFAKSSSTVEFSFNPKFFEEDATVDTAEFERLVLETAYLNSGLTLRFDDRTTGKKETYKFDNGVVEFLKKRVPDSIVPVIEFPSDVVNKNKIEIAMTYNTGFGSDDIASFCNTINTSEGGTHVTGFKRSISQKLLAYILDKKLVKEAITNDDIFIGLSAVVSVFVFNPKYSTQTKTKLSNTDVNGSVLAYTNRVLNEWLNTDPPEVKLIAKKIELAAKSRIAQKRALDSIKKESGALFSSLSSIAKFADCQENMSGRTELFLVEGDSAGGTVTTGRDREYQAVYKLRGKVLNTHNMELHKARKNTEIDDLISILRCGTGDTLDINTCKFNKIITLADADDDGFI
jgi:DNA gyrase subunit B